MDTIVLFNPTESEIRDYPIQNAKTKETKLWSILPGETLEFPKDVGNYLLEVYAFLQRVVTEEELREEEEHKKKISEGKQFSQVKVIKADGPVVPKEEKPAGFTSELMREPNPTPPAQKVEEEELKKDIGDSASTGPVQCPKCPRTFANKMVMKTHYAQKHLEL